MNAAVTPTNIPKERPVQQRTWLTWGAGVFLIVEVVHAVVAVVVNEWEGWRIFLENLLFIVVSGLIVVGLIYGLLVRWAMKKPAEDRNRPASAGMWTGILSVVAYGAFFIWAPFLIGPAAVLLAREGLRHVQESGLGRGRAMVGGSLGALSLAFGIFLIVFALIRGDYPWFI